jgi:hypothetical protein
MSESDPNLFDGAKPGWDDRSSRKDQNDDRGLVCPGCGCRHFEVYYTRETKHGTIIRRRRCRHCGRSVMTTERITGTR